MSESDDKPQPSPSEGVKSGGYKNIDKKYCWPKGKSGNPDGKKKRRLTFDDHLDRAMDSKVAVVENGRRKKKSRDEISALRVANESCQNTKTALVVSGRRAQRREQQRQLYESETPLPEDDQAIIDAYFAGYSERLQKLAGAAAASTPSEDKTRAADAEIPPADDTPTSDTAGDVRVDYLEAASAVAEGSSAGDAPASDPVAAPDATLASETKPACDEIETSARTTLPEHPDTSSVDHEETRVGGDAAVCAPPSPPKQPDARSERHATMPSWPPTVTIEVDPKTGGKVHKTIFFKA